jgi:streptothricin acetyltransferase
MTNPFEITPLLTINLAVLLPITTGYVSTEKYIVEKSETDSQTTFHIRLVQLEEPYRKSFSEDFNDADCLRYGNFLGQGYSFEVHHQDRVVAFAISEAVFWNQSLMIWEFQVMEEFRHLGIGRALMNRVVAKAIQDHFRIVTLETQNTNVGAIRFYRKLGFSLDAVDLSLYTNQDVEAGEVAFFMKRKLPCL